MKGIIIDWTSKIECPHCHSLIEFTNADIYHKYTAFKINSILDCPKCKESFIIKYPDNDKVKYIK